MEPASRETSMAAPPVEASDFGGDLIRWLGRLGSGHVKFWIARGLGRGLPTGASFWLAERLADLYSAAAVRDRATVRRNLGRVLGVDTPSDASVREVFRSFARYLVEFMVADRLEALPVRVDGIDAVSRVLPPGRPAIVLTAHIGNWELGAMRLARLGYPMTVVARQHADPRTTRLYASQRSRGGVEVIPLGGGGVSDRCLAALRAGRCVGLVGDRDFIGNGLPLPLLGVPSMIPRGPAVLSCRSGAPVVPMFFIREGRWRFRFELCEPIPPRGPDGRLQPIDELTRRYAAALEWGIMRHPEQWIMF